MKIGRARSAVAAVVVPLLGLFIVVPLGLIVLKSLGHGPAVYAEAIESASNRSALFQSLEIGAGVAAIAFLLGAPLGAALARLKLGGAGVLATLLVLPLAAPSYVWAMAWIALAAPKAGWLNLLAPRPWVDIYGLGGIIFVEGLALYPLVLLPTRAALESADPSLEEAARIGGAGPLRAFFTGSAPLAAPAAVSGALLAFLASISSFGVPYLLGIATAHPTLVATTRIYQALALAAEKDVRGAIALCMLLLVFAGLAAFLAARAAPARPSGAGKGRRVARIDSPALARLATTAAWSVVSIAVILPIAAVILSAFTKHYGRPPSLDNFTTEQFTGVLGKADIRAAIVRSALLAISAATVVVAMGAALAFLRRGRAGKAASGLLRLAEAPYAIPGSVLALAFLTAFSQPVRLILLDRVTIVFEIAGTLWILGIAYAVKYLAFGARASDDAFRAIDPALEEAARISGAAPGRAFFDVALPLARPALVAAWILVFLPAATELTMSVLLVGTKTQVLGTVLFELASYADPPSAAVLACVVLALAATADILLRRIAGASGVAA